MSISASTLTNGHYLCVHFKDEEMKAIGKAWSREFYFLKRLTHLTLLKCTKVKGFEKNQHPIIDPIDYLIKGYPTFCGGYDRYQRPYLLISVNYILPIEDTTTNRCIQMILIFYKVIKNHQHVLTTYKKQLASDYHFYPTPQEFYKEYGLPFPSCEPLQHLIEGKKVSLKSGGYMIRVSTEKDA